MPAMDCSISLLPSLSLCLRLSLFPSLLPSLSLSLSISFSVSLLAPLFLSVPLSILIFQYSCFQFSLVTYLGIGEGDYGWRTPSFPSLLPETKQIKMKIKNKKKKVRLIIRYRNTYSNNILLWNEASSMSIKNDNMFVRTFSSGRERREKGRVGNRLFTSLKNAREDLTCTDKNNHRMNIR